MTPTEILVFVAGVIVAFALLLGLVVLIVRRTMNKPPKRDRECNHYYESGQGSNYGGSSSPYGGGHDSGGFGGGHH